MKRGNVGNTGKARVRNHFGRTPRKGTKSRMLLLMAMRSQGLHMDDLLYEPGMEVTRHSFAGILDRIRDFTGWDICTCPVPTTYARQGGRPGYVYRVEGRMRWDGTYRKITYPSPE